MTKHKEIFCIDIGGTHTKLGIVNFHSGEILHHQRIPTEAKCPFSELLERIKCEFNLIKEKYSITGIGVGAPNANFKTGEMVTPPNFHWSKTNLASEIKSSLGIETRVDNDANMAALGEKYFGKGADYKNFMVVTLGTGLGTGIILNDEIYRGHRQLSGEGGHITAGNEGRICGCGGVDHIETYSGASGISTTFQNLTEKNLHFTEVRDLFLKDDKVAKTCIEQTMEKLGKTLAGIQSLLDFEKIFLTGGVTSLGTEIIPMLEYHLNKHVFKNFKQANLIEFCDTPYKYGALHGACALFKEK